MGLVLRTPDGAVMDYSESAIGFRCGDQRLMGVITAPQTPRPVGVIIVVGGPQYRSGSHRQFTLLSRALASNGFAALRFDYRGMGDSDGPRHDFLQVGEDIEAAIGALQDSLPQVRHVVLWGLCDAASAALLYIGQRADRRVAGLCLLNPWVRSGATLARTHVRHYYLQRLRQRAFWSKLLRGEIATAAVRELWSSLKAMRRPIDAAAAIGQPQSFQARMEEALRRSSLPTCLILSGNDFTAKEFLEYAASRPRWSDILARGSMTRHDLPDADHTFSSAVWRSQVERMTCNWLEGLALVPPDAA